MVLRTEPTERVRCRTFCLEMVGKGVEEIRVWDDAGTFRVIYTARLANAVCVLHAFQKKTQATSKRDIEIAKARFILLMKGEK